MGRITLDSSIIKPVLAGLIAITLLGTLLLSMSTWRKVAILESELINREVIPPDYAEKKSLIPAKPAKFSSKKQNLKIKHRKTASKVIAAGVTRFPGAETAGGSKVNSRQRKRRTLDDVLYDIADTMIVVEDK